MLMHSPGATPTRSFLPFVLAPACLLAVACVDADEGPLGPTDGSTGPNGGEALPIESLALGQEHTCAAVDDGSVHCWGAGGAGQLGTGERDNLRSAGQALGLTDTARVFAGRLTTCAITGSDETWCWGQVVAHATESRAEPERMAEIDGIVDLDIAETIACAAHADGAVSCWGMVSLYTDHDDDPVAVPSPVDALQGAVRISTGGAYVCTLRQDEQVECLGLHPTLDVGAGEEPTTPQVIAGVDGATELATGYQHACARLANDTVSCWGENFRGELGRGTVSEFPGDRLDPEPVTGLDGVVSLAAGHAFTCAVRGDGTVWCWGDSSNYALGEAVMDGSPAPEPVQVVGVADAVRVKAGHHFACALLADASALCWGFGTDTDGGIRPSATPLPFPW
jgi:alpha-tubulin suppressor-like RCC1 family protein